MTAKEVKEALRKRHELPVGAWACVEEAFSGWQSLGGGVDLFAIGGWRSASVGGLEGCGKYPVINPLVSYEVKVSRGDFRRELYGYTPSPEARRARPVKGWPFKAYWALERSHYFVFAVPEGLLGAHELTREKPPEGRRRPLYVPHPAGLVEVLSDGSVKVRLKASPGEPRPLERGEIAELLRHGIDPNRERQLRVRVAELEWRYNDMRRQRDALLDERDGAR